MMERDSRGGNGKSYRSGKNEKKRVLFFCQSAAHDFLLFRAGLGS